VSATAAKKRIRAAIVALDEEFNLTLDNCSVQSVQACSAYYQGS